MLQLSYFSDIKESAMAIKKSELYSSLWASCDELRGGMDASMYKDYVLVLLFIKYVSDKYSGIPYAPITIPPGAGFKDMAALKGSKDIGDKINKIIGKIAEANKLTGTIDVADFNNADKLGDAKTMVDRLTKLIAIFEKPALDFSRNRAEGDDLLGDAYEYLMRNFATESGKSKGQFYTPAEVSRILAKVIGVDSTAPPSTKVYDPTCGSGSLLLKVADEAEKSISIYGQENDTATAALARMNMILHNNPSAEIKQGNTLANPLFLDGASLRQFDYVVANPPFSFKSWSNGLDADNDTFRRFKDYGVPPAKNGDYAFLLHIIHSLKSRGKGACILPHGVLFRGNAEAQIRSNIIKKGYIKGIIGLPPNLFYGTGIPACIIVIDKENANNRKGVFMIDASRGFIKDGNKNRLREQDIHRIVDVFNRQIEIEKYSRMVPVTEIENNGYNLNIPRYIDSQEAEDIQSIEAHLNGGIPDSDVEALNSFWEVYSGLKKTLFASSGRPGFSKLLVPHDSIKPAIFSHAEFTAYSGRVVAVFNKWRSRNIVKLKAISGDDRPKKLISDIAEDLLQTFSDVKLIDKYDIYQYLLVYWAEVMQDDVYALVADGWMVGREIERQDKKREWEGLLIPKSLMTAKYFSEEQKIIERLESERDDITRQIEELVEEHGGDEGLLSDSKNEKDKVTKIFVQKRFKEIEKDKEAVDERKVLQQYLKLSEQETEAAKKVKDAAAKLEKKVLDKYSALSEADIKNIIVEDKWIAALERDVKTEMERISQRLTGRIKELAGRYAQPLPGMTQEVEALENKVKAHLKKMGYVWR
jgi:type I restriction enzyme M protein